MIDETIFDALKGLVPNTDGATFRVFPDVAPEGTALPWLTYQSVGGQAVPDLDGPAETLNARMQISVWAATRTSATRLMQQASAAMCDEPLNGVAIGAAVSVYEQSTKLYGSRLDFSVWYQP